MRARLDTSANLDSAPAVDLEPADDGPLTLDEILNADNLAELLTDTELGRIGSDVIRDFQIDVESRKDWLPRYERCLDAAMQVRKAKNSPWPGASNVKFPLLTTASIQFQARAYPAIVDGSNLVKGRVLGPDPDGQKRQRADRIGQHMTWQLLYRMPGWEEDTDKLLLMLPIAGNVFRKTFFDPIAKANRSTMISAEDFVVNYWAKSLEEAPRYTHVVRLYPHEVRERVLAGLWLKVPADQIPEEANDEQGQVEFLEQHRLIDLDADGYPEPYVVTTTRDGTVARIVACFGPEDVTVQAPGGTAKLVDLLDEQREDEAGEIVRIERRQYFTKYGFIPAPDGSFYDIGFGTLLDDISRPIDSAINAMLDAAALQNNQGGFVGSGVNIKSGNFTFRLGEWKRVDVTGGTLRENIVPLTLPGPSAVLFSLLGMLIEAAKEITSVQDVMTGEGTANQPATTTLALIEQGAKVMTGIFKRIHRAFGGELRILRRLNRENLDDEEYFQLNDMPETDEAGNPVPADPIRVGRADYEDDDLDVVPVSDPSAASDMQKMARAQALMVWNGDPLVNQAEIRRRYMEAIGEKDIKALLTAPEPPPDPKVLEAGAKLALEKEKAGADVRAKDAASAEKLGALAEKLLGLGLVDDAATVAGAAVELGGTVDDPAGEGSIPGVAGGPPDGGVLPIPEGSPGGPLPGLGGGQDALAGAAGAGGAVGPAGGPVA
jgi:chaperonin GroES